MERIISEYQIQQIETWFSNLPAIGQLIVGGGALLLIIVGGLIAFLLLTFLFYYIPYQLTKLLSVLSVFIVFPALFFLLSDEPNGFFFCVVIGIIGIKNGLRDRKKKRACKKLKNATV